MSHTAKRASEDGPLAAKRQRLSEHGEPNTLPLRSSNPTEAILAHTPSSESESLCRGSPRSFASGEPDTRIPVFPVPPESAVAPHQRANKAQDNGTPKNRASSRPAVSALDWKRLLSFVSKTRPDVRNTKQTSWRGMWTDEEEKVSKWSLFEGKSLSAVSDLIQKPALSILRLWCHQLVESVPVEWVVWSPSEDHLLNKLLQDRCVLTEACERLPARGIYEIYAHVVLKYVRKLVRQRYMEQLENTESQDQTQLMNEMQVVACVIIRAAAAARSFWACTLPARKTALTSQVVSLTPQKQEACQYLPAQPSPALNPLMSPTPIGYPLTLPDPIPVSGAEQSPGQPPATILSLLSSPLTTPRHRMSSKSPSRSNGPHPSPALKCGPSPRISATSPRHTPMFNPLLEPKTHRRPSMSPSLKPAAIQTIIHPANPESGSDSDDLIECACGSGKLKGFAPTPEARTVRCSVCKLPGDVPVAIKKCACGSGMVPVYGTPGEKRRVRCGSCRQPDDVRFVSKRTGSASPRPTPFLNIPVGDSALGSG